MMQINSRGRAGRRDGEERPQPAALGPRGPHAARRLRGPEEGHRRHGQGPEGGEGRRREAEGLLRGGAAQELHGARDEGLGSKEGIRVILKGLEGLKGLTIST